MFNTEVESVRILKIKISCWLTGLSANQLTWRPTAFDDTFTCDRCLFGVNTKSQGRLLI